MRTTTCKHSDQIRNKLQIIKCIASELTPLNLSRHQNAGDKEKKKEKSEGKEPETFHLTQLPKIS